MRPPSVSLRQPSDVSLSIIIPAHNEAAYLPATLESVRAAVAETRTHAEVLVVNDDSSDATAQIARVAGAHVLDVRRRQICAVRNAGAAAARGRMLVFLDADTRLPAATLRRALGALENGAIGGGARVVFDEVPRAAGILAAAFGATWVTLCRWAAGCFIFCQRAAFEAVGGFDEQFYVAEELYLSRALKRRGRFVLLASPVITSARKVRARPTAALTREALHLLLAGPRAWRDKSRLSMWYGAQRR